MRYSASCSARPAPGPDVAVVVRDLPIKWQRREFVRAAWDLLGEESNWAPPIISDELAQLDPRRNPFLAGAHVCLFMVKRRDQIVGRVAYLEGPYLVAGFAQGVACFGYFACRPDVEATVALLDSLTSYARKRRRSVLIGPFNPTLYDSPGILEEGFDAKPTLLTSFNPPYYGALLLEAAFSRFKELLGFEINVSEKVPDMLERAEQLAFRSGIQIRNPDFRAFSQELRKFFEVQWHAIMANWGEVAFTEEQREYVARRLRPLLHRDLIVFGYYENKPAGVALAIPDGYEALKTLDGRLWPIRVAKAFYCLSKTHSIRVPLIGVLPQHRRRGIDGALVAAMWRAAYRRGIRKCDMSWVLADNHVMINTINNLGAVRRRSWWLYSKQL